MSEIKTLNGYSLADTKAREDIASLTKENVNIWAEIDALKSDDNVETTKKVKSGQFVSFTPVLKTSTSVKNKMIMNTAFEWSNVNAIRLVSGQNVMDFTPFVGAPGTVYEKNGLRAVVNDDGTMTVSGTNTSTGWTNVFEKMVSYKNQQYQAFPAGTYTIPDGMIMQIIGLNGAWDSISGNKQGTFTVDRAFYVYNVMVAFAGSLTVNKTIPLCMVRGNAIPSSGYVYEGTVYSVTFSSKVADGVFDWQTGVLKDSDGNEIEKVESFDEFPVFNGVNTVISPLGDATVTYKTYGEGGTEVTDAFDPTVWGMPILYLTGDASSMTKDISVTLNYIYGEQAGTCTCKWQGSSSLAYEKKNYTIKFDTAFEAVEGWTAQKKYCFKANYIDHSHARNIVNAKLWGQIVKSRDTVPAEFANLVNAGAVDGFPVIIVLNDDFLGLYTFNIPKDAWMMGMGSGTNECILCAGNACPANGFKETATLEGENDLEIEYITNEDDTAWAKTSVNNLINACINSNGSDLDTTIAPMLDWQSAIDYYIFAVLVAGHDMTLKNYLLSTFDGTKWYFGAYDMDCTYGLWWNGKTWLPADNAPSFTSYAGQHRVMELIKLHKKDALKARYAELRETVLSESNIATTFANFCGQIPKPVYMQDAKRWPMTPNTSTNDITQIRDYYRMRVALADKWIEAL